MSHPGFTWQTLGGVVSSRPAVSLRLEIALDLFSKDFTKNSILHCQVMTPILHLLLSRLYSDVLSFEIRELG
jgi:hypothetical protein